MYKLFNNIGKVKIVQIRSIPPSYGPFAIEREETAKKFFFKLMLFLDIFQYKNHIWHINKNFIFLAVSSLSTEKGPYESGNPFDDDRKWDITEVTGDPLAMIVEWAVNKRRK